MYALSEINTQEKKLIKKYGKDVMRSVATGKDFLSLASFLKAKLSEEDYETAVSIAFWMFADTLDSIAPPKRNPEKLFDEVLEVSKLTTDLYQPK